MTLADAKEPNGSSTPLGAAAASQAVLVAALLGIGSLIANLGRGDVQEISFQHFKNSLLNKGLVDRVEVTNKTTAKVYVRQSSRCASSLWHALQSRIILQQGMGVSC